MRKVMIDFYDRDVISTLVPIYSLKPDVEYLIINKRKRATKTYNSMVKEIKKVEGIEFCEKLVDADCYSDIDEVLESIIQANLGAEIYIDFTGGSELMIACGGVKAAKYGIVATYVDFRVQNLINVKTGEKICPAVELELSSYLNVIGAKPLNDSHDLPLESEFDNIVKMSEYLFDHERLWHRLWDKFSAYLSDHKGMVEFRLSTFGNDFEQMLDTFAKYGFIKKQEGQRYRLVDDRYTGWMATYGVWLEMYIYIKAKESYDHVQLGYVIDWDSSDGMDIRGAEIDVVIMHNSIPVFISCKMTHPTGKDITQVGYNIHLLGGKRAKAIMAVVDPKKKDGDDVIYKKMKAVNIGVIDAMDFRTATYPKQIISDVINSIE